MPINKCASCWSAFFCMKVCSFFHGVLKDNIILLKVNDPKDLYNIRRMFKSKKEREDRSQKEILLKCEIDAAFQKRSFKQLAAVWKLIEVIFESENERLPLEEEKYDLYLDLLTLYADKVPNRYNNQLRDIHISEANTVAGSHFIEGLLYHLSTLCDLTQDQDSTVRNILYQWEIWRGKQENDINDERTINDIRQYVKFSEASGRGGVLHLHHIVTRGSCPAAIDKAWNIMVLTEDEHNFFHQQCKNWDEFLEVYPHLRGKVEKAYEKAAKLMQEVHAVGNLADEAMEELLNG